MDAAAQLDPDNIEAFARLILNAVQGGNWGLLAALAVVALVWGLRKFGGEKFPFLRTDRGGALLALAMSVAGAVATALLAGSSLSVGLFITAFAVSLKAAGGFVLVKKLLFGSHVDVAVAAGAAAAGEVKTTADALRVLDGQK